MSLNLLKITKEYLQNNPESKFTARQIANWIFDTFPEQCRQKQAESRATKFPLDTEKALLQQIAAEISSRSHVLQTRFPQIKTTEGRPRQYYYTEQTDQDELSSAETITNVADQPLQHFSEHDLYPLVGSFLFAEFNVHCKRIDERRSSNTRGSGGNKWLFPDIVGLENLNSDWHPEIRACAKEFGDKKAKLWSFEVKLLVNRSNVREVYFQAVSNSSWANYGYLVTSQISGNETMAELRMLSSLHGIGVILLDKDDPTQSEVRIPARERTHVDWNTASRLTSENPDFREFINLVKEFYLTDKVRPAEWDYIAEG